MCNDTFSKILAFIGALVLGVAIALLYNFSFITDPRTLVYVGIGLAAAMLVYMLVALFGTQRSSKCICNYAGPVTYASLLSLVAAAVTLAVTPATATAVALRTTITLGVWSTLLFFAVILFIMFIDCIIKARCGCKERCSTCDSCNTCSCTANSCSIGGMNNCRY